MIKLSESRKEADVLTPYAGSLTSMFKLLKMECDFKNVDPTKSQINFMHKATRRTSDSNPL